MTHHPSSSRSKPSTINHHPSSNHRFTFVNLVLISIIVASLVLFIYPMFKPGIIAGHDTGARFVHVQMMAQALKDGEFPVRWVEGPTKGLSHALFNYYPPLFYYPPAILTLLGVGLIPSVYITIALFAVIGWLGMYVLVRALDPLLRGDDRRGGNDKKTLRHPRENGDPEYRRWFWIPASAGMTRGRAGMTRGLLSSMSAVLAATLFLFTPYRISQIYVRAAYMEFAATSVIPFAFLGILNIFQGRKISGLITTAVSLALIITLHQPTFIMVLPALLAWIGYLWIINYSHKEKLILRLAGFISFLAIGVGLLLTASFVFPLIGESNLIRPVGLSAGYFDFRQHFATISQLIYSAWGYGISQPGPNDNMSFQVGVLNWVAMIGAVLLLLLGVVRRFKLDSRLRGNDKKTLRHPRENGDPEQGWIPAYAGMTKGRGGMTRGRVGDGKKGLLIFFVLVTVYGVFMSVSSSLPIWERFSIFSYIQYPWRYLAVTSFATSVLAGIVFYQIYKSFSSLKIIAEKSWLWVIIFVFISVIFNWQYLAPAAYLPSDSFTFGSPKFPRTSPLSGLEPSYFPVHVTQINSDPSIPRFRLVQGKAIIKSLTDKTTFQEFSAHVTSPAVIQINTHYFPGWQAKINNGKEISFVTPGYNNAEGNMEITLTPGDYKVSLRFTNTPIRQIANYLSLGTIIGLVILIVFPYSRFKRIRYILSGFPPPRE